MFDFFSRKVAKQVVFRKTILYNSVARESQDTSRLENLSMAAKRGAPNLRFPENQKTRRMTNGEKLTGFQGQRSRSTLGRRTAQVSGFEPHQDPHLNAQKPKRRLSEHHTHRIVGIGTTPGKQRKLGTLKETRPEIEKNQKSGEIWKKTYDVQRGSPEKTARPKHALEVLVLKQQRRSHNHRQIRLFTEQI